MLTPTPGISSGIEFVARNWTPCTWACWTPGHSGTGRTSASANTPHLVWKRSFEPKRFAQYIRKSCFHIAKHLVLLRITVPFTGQTSGVGIWGSCSSLRTDLTKTAGWPVQFTCSKRGCSSRFPVATCKEIGSSHVRVSIAKLRSASTLHYTSSSTKTLYFVWKRSFLSRNYLLNVLKSCFGFKNSATIKKVLNEN